MKKKFITLGIAFLMLFWLVACNDFDLANYKTEAKAEIESYATESTYCEDNWTIVCSIVDEGKQVVDAAKSKPDVDNAVSNAKTAINGVEKEEVDMEWVLEQFDLTEPKITWQGNIDEEFTDDIVLLTLKKTSTYPELHLKHFGLDNAVAIEYVGGVRPPDYFFTEGYEQALDDYRQIIIIRILSQGKNKVVDTIRKIEKLDFVRSVSPNNVDRGD